MPMPAAEIDKLIKAALPDAEVELVDLRLPVGCFRNSETHL